MYNKSMARSILKNAIHCIKMRDHLKVNEVAFHNT